MSQLENFTSLPPSEERTFVVYEEYMMVNSRRATRVGMIAGGIVGLLVVLIVFAVTPDKKQKISADDMQGLTRTKKEKGEPPASPPAETPAPAAGDPP